MFNLWICFLFCAIYSVRGNAPPICTPDVAIVNADEDEAVNYLLATPNCLDSDPGAEGTISYSITSGNAGGEFSVHPSTGKVTLATTLDYETTTSYILEVLVQDGGTPALSSNFTVYIQVNAVNEYDPQITPLVLSRRYESFLGKLAELVATDADAGPDGELGYAITAGNDDGIFHIDQYTGYIYVVQPLDYDTVQSHTLQIDVYDRSLTAPRVSSTSVTLPLRNVNEHPPVCQTFFYKSMYENYIDNKVDGIIAKIKRSCTDIDDPGPWPTRTFIVPEGDYTKFNINMWFGTAKLNAPIDPDTEKSLYFQEYIVRDVRLPYRTSTVAVFLKIKGVDDNPTVWPTTDMREEISEDAIPGADVIMTLAATDGDRSDTPEGSLSYRIENQTSTGQFYVHPNGNVHLVLPLDRETNDEIMLTVYVITANMPTVKLFANITFTVTDVNDNAPAFVTPVYWDHITDGTDYSSTPILTVLANDPDDGANGTVAYSITDGDPGGIFSIDANTGVITSSVVFDFETNSLMHYELTITAQDGDTAPLSSTALVILDVSPLNEFDPVVNGNQTFTISEGVAIGSTLFTLNTTDDDDGPDGELWYAWSSDVFPFMVHKYTGDITLIGTLDRETASQHIFEIIIYDSSETDPRSSTATVTVVVGDENDNQPYCEPARYADISALDGAGTEVVSLGCSDADLGANAALSYSIVSGNINNDLTVDTNGKVTLTRSPSTVKYDLEVLVEDSGLSPLNMTVTVSISAHLVPPLTNLPTVIDFPENTTEASVLFEVNSTALGVVSYYIASGNGEGKFSIGRASGKLYLASQLDKETTESYLLTILVTDLSSGLTSTGNITLNVEDVNDNAPAFGNSFYIIPVTEDVANGTEIIDLDAIDADVDAVNRQVSFIIASGNEDGKFSIDSDGKVTVVASLDHETKTTYSVVIEAIDNAPTGSLTGATTVQIEVLNQDEYPPVFNFSGTKYETSLTENSPLGGVILQVHADDLDMEKLTYAMYSGDNSTFHVDSLNGKIYLSKTLDREVQDFQQMVVSARSPSGSSSTATVEIRVLDINDNDPVFSAGVYSSSIAETATVGATVFTLNSTDPDIDMNANITYNIVAGNAAGHFRLEDSEILTDSTLDYNSMNYYRIVIQASDQGIPQRFTSAVVVIEVILDPVPPKFSPNFDSVNIPESSLPGLEVYDADATALGAKETPPGTLRYSIFSGNTDDVFSIVENSGKVFLAGPVDADGPLAVRILQLMATNTLGASLTDNLTLTVTISDVNDNRPSFLQVQYTASVPHGSTAGLSVLTVNATDLDSGVNGLVSYSLSGVGSSDFIINSTTGLIEVANTLDYFSKDRYILTVDAVDGGVSAMTTQAVLVINVALVQNNAPSFPDPTLSVIVGEETAGGSTIFQVIAIDQDVGPNGLLNYSFSSGNLDGRFAIDPSSGIITVDPGGLDREDKDSYNLEILCEDGGTPSLSSTTVLTVLVLDDNDSPPVFNTTAYSAMVHKDVAVGFRLTTVGASDEDIGYNSLITYSITAGNAANLFEINPYSGVVSVQGGLTVAVGNHVLTVEAKDSGTTPLTNNVPLTITVSAGASYTFSLSENQGANTFVGQVTEPGPVTFSVVAGDLNGEFSIDGGTGDLKTTGGLDRESVPEYHLTVHVEETANPSNWYNILVTVTVDDENDHSPIFTQNNYTVSIVEGSPVGFTVFKLPVSDDDEGVNAQIDLEILDAVSQAVFDVSSSTLELRVKTPPSYDIRTFYHVQIKASDNGLPKKSKVSTVRVYIVDIGAPTITPTVGSGDAMYVSLECSHIEVAGTVVHTFSGESFGFNSSGLLSIQYITLQTESSPFLVGAASGEIQVSNTNLLYKDSKYVFWIVAKAVFADASEESRQGIVRIDTFDPSDKIIKIAMDIPKENLQGDGDSEAFISLLRARIPTGRAGIWKVEDEAVTTSRRRLLAQGTTVFIYAIKSLDTDSLSGINTPKHFYTDLELLLLLQASTDGTPIVALTGGAFANYSIVYVLDEILEPTPVDAWIETTPGIAIISMICIGILLLIVLLLLYFLCTRSGNKRTEPRGSISFSKSEGDTIDDTTMEKPLFPASRSPPPPYQSRPATRRHKTEIINGVAYDGRSYDEKTGIFYVINTHTGQRKISNDSKRTSTANSFGKQNQGQRADLPHGSTMSIEGSSDQCSVDSFETTSTLQLKALATEDVRSEYVLTRPLNGDPNARLSRSKNTSIGSGLNVDTTPDIPLTPVMSHKQLESTL